MSLQYLHVAMGTTQGAKNYRQMEHCDHHLTTSMALVDINGQHMNVEGCGWVNLDACHLTIFGDMQYDHATREVHEQ